LYLIFLLGGYRAGGKGVCGRLMSPAHETQSMREIRLLRGRLPQKGGGLTGMVLDQYAEMDFYSANSLKQQSAVRHVAPLGHIILILSQPIFALSP
jgi:hypothetical protein